MFLDLDIAGIPMKMVYLLSEELKVNPERVALTQALTLNQDKPLLGLKGAHGLFGSQEWWDNLYKKNMPLLFMSGIIKDIYVAGQDPSPVNNTIDFLKSDGSVGTESIYVNNKQDITLFRIGHKVEIAYVLDELKAPARNGGVNYADDVLEMAVSLQPVK